MSKKPQTPEQQQAADAKACIAEGKQGAAEAKVLKEAVHVIQDVVDHKLFGEKEIGVLAAAQKIIHKHIQEDSLLTNVPEAVKKADAALENAVKNHDFSGLKDILATVQSEARASERINTTMMGACMATKAEGHAR